VLQKHGRESVLKLLTEHKHLPGNSHHLFWVVASEKAAVGPASNSFLSRGLIFPSHKTVINTIQVPIEQFCWMML